MCLCLLQFVLKAVLCYENSNYCCVSSPTVSHECRPNTALVPHLQLCCFSLLLMLHRDQLEPRRGIVVIPRKLQLMKTVQSPLITLCVWGSLCAVSLLCCPVQCIKKDTILSIAVSLFFVSFLSFKAAPAVWDERSPLVVSYQVPSQLALHGRWESVLKGFSLHLIAGVQREWGVCRRVGGEWRHEANYKGSEWENESRRRWHSALETSKCWLLFK